MTKLIAEIGINHGGDVLLAFEMIERAKAAGADFVKFQKRDIDTCYTKDELAAPCESPFGATVEDKVRGRELGWDSFRAIASKCDMEGIGWGCSCFDLNSLRQLEFNFGDVVAFHKVPSCMAKHAEFLKAVASFGRLTLVSVGLAKNLQEVSDVCNIFEAAGCPYVLNVTTSVYPTPPNRCNLGRVAAFHAFREAKLSDLCRGIGYSGHEVGILPSVVAALEGADWVERHFTTDRSLYGADQASSLEPQGLERLRRDLDQLEVLYGDDEVQLYGDEKNPVPNINTEKRTS